MYVFVGLLIEYVERICRALAVLSLFLFRPSSRTVNVCMCIVPVSDGRGTVFVDDNPSYRPYVARVCRCTLLLVAKRMFPPLSSAGAKPFGGQGGKGVLRTWARESKESNQQHRHLVDGERPETGTVWRRAHHRRDPGQGTEPYHTNPLRPQTLTPGREKTPRQGSLLGSTPPSLAAVATRHRHRLSSAP